MTDEYRQTPGERLGEARRRDAVGATRGAEIEAVSDRLQTVIDAAERAAEAIRWDAEEQARNHLAEAQRKADRLTAERVGLVARLTDDLIEHAGVVKSHSEQMVGALEEAIATVNAKLEDTELPTPQAARPGIPPPPGPPPSGGRPQTSFEAPPERIVEPARTGAPPVEAEIRRRTEVITDSGASPRGASPAPASAEAAIPAAASETGGESRAAETSAKPESAAAAAAEPSREMMLRATQLAVAGGSRESIAQALRGEFDADPAVAVDRVMPGE